jgi:hypothetical protein
MEVIMNDSIIRKLIRDVNKPKEENVPEAEPIPISQGNDTVGQYTIVFDRSDSAHKNNQEKVKKQ